MATYLYLPSNVTPTGIMEGLEEAYFLGDSDVYVVCQGVTTPADEVLRALDELVTTMENLK